jgi:hypothetical protein
MLIGHYAVAMGLKKTAPKASLGLLFLAVQLADILFFPFVLLGIERGSIVPGITQASDLRLDYAPFTHGLLGALVTSAVVYGLFQLLPIREGVNKRLLGLVMGVAVFSHFVLDVLVHTPDMALVDGGLPHVGLGLWNSAIATYIVEAAIVLVGLWLYLRSTEGTTFLAKYGMPIYVALLLLLNVFNLFQPPAAPGSNLSALAIPALVMYAVFAALAFWLDGKRAPRAA